MHHSISKRKQLREAYVQLCQKMQPTAFLTLATNRSASTDSLRRLISAYCARMDRKLLGHLWNRTPAADRTDGIFFIEHVKSNIHAHGILRYPSAHLMAPTLLSVDIWQKLCPSGSAVLRPIEDLNECASYCTKEMPFSTFQEDQIILVRELMNARS